MKRILIAVAVMGLLGASAPAGAKTSTPPRVKLTMSNFRYCKAKSCSATDVGYVRTSSMPVPGTDNPLQVVPIKRYSIVSWIYRDTQCDSLGCAGHNIYFENGKAGVKKGFSASGKRARPIVVTITQKKGTLIRYFCTVSGHYQTGMTGLIRVT